MIIIAYAIIFFLPRLFKDRFLSFLLIFYGITFAGFFDNTIGAAPFDYYDIMDGPKYTIMDLFAYLVYGPYGYLFIYYYEKFHITGKKVIIYIMIWMVIGIVFEWINLKFEVFTYKGGYKLAYSIPIYLAVQSILILFYKYIKR